jgi:hypothetical protein
MASTPFILGISVTSAALAAASGTGLSASDVAAVSADAVAGKEVAKESTVLRRAEGDSWVGGMEASGAGTVLKSVGWALSVDVPSVTSLGEDLWVVVERTDLEQLGIDAEAREKVGKAPFEIAQGSNYWWCCWTRKRRCRPQEDVFYANKARLE